jgi:hypothetical protein
MTKDEALDLVLEFFETMQRYKGTRSSIFIRFEPTATGNYVDLREFDEKAKPIITAIKQARSAPEEPVYHLRQFGDVTKEQLDRYMATGDINPQPAPVQPVALDVTLDGEEAKLLRDMLGDDRDELSPVRLLVGNGHSGHGLYAAHAEYQEEGAVLLAATPSAAPVPLTLGQKQRLWSSVGDKPTLKDRVNAYGLAIEAAHGITKGQP